jgi:hypothetical protein
MFGAPRRRMFKGFSKSKRFGYLTWCTIECAAHLVGLSQILIRMSFAIPQFGSTAMGARH